MAKSARMPSAKTLEKLLGVSFSPDTLKEIKRPPLPKNQALTVSLQLEATLNSLAYPERQRVSKTCKNESCPYGKLFYTEYNYLSYCSDECRRFVLSKQYGIEAIEELYHGRNEIRIWDGRVPPASIPPEALSVMKYLVEQAEKNQGQTIQPWLPPAKPKQVSKPSPKPILHSVPEPPKEIDDLLSGIPKLDSLSELLRDVG
jgi:hypothetical protein